MLFPSQYWQKIRSLSSVPVLQKHLTETLMYINNHYKFF